MTLRPRYSLLTLLVLTALVAGGVKLWYGPHHVVEQTAAGDEEEYTYTRSWRGERVIQGPHVRRSFSKSQELTQISVIHFRQGKQLDVHYMIWVMPPGEEPKNMLPNIQLESPLSSEESNLFAEVTAQERQKASARGLKIDSGFWPPSTSR